VDCCSGLQGKNRRTRLYVCVCLTCVQQLKVKNELSIVGRKQKQTHTPVCVRLFYLRSTIESQKRTFNCWTQAKQTHTPVCVRLFYLRPSIESQKRTFNCWTQAKQTHTPVCVRLFYLRSTIQSQKRTFNCWTQG
jgi:predicted component of type VI protein secretion system